MSSIYNNFSIKSNINTPKINFRSTVAQYTPVRHGENDVYISNPLYEKFGTKAEIEVLAKTNPRIKEMMAEHNLPIVVNHEELDKLKSGHLKNTRIRVAKMYSELPDDLKATVNPAILQEAAIFHDYGKVLIPSDILNKEGSLTEEEWRIMQLHPEIGAELLKGKVDNRALYLVKYHHQDSSGTGYPVMENYVYGLDSELIMLADKYEALTENRSYKKALPKEEALAIIENDVRSGRISQEAFDALMKTV